MRFETVLQHPLPEGRGSVVSGGPRAVTLFEAPTPSPKTPHDQLAVGLLMVAIFTMAHSAFRIPHSALKGTTPLRSLRDSQLEGVAKSPQATTKIKPRCEMRNAETAGGAFRGFCLFCGEETAGGGQAEYPPRRVRRGGVETFYISSPDGRPPRASAAPTGLVGYDMTRHRGSACGFTPA